MTYFLILSIPLSDPLSNSLHSYRLPKSIHKQYGEQCQQGHYHPKDPEIRRNVESGTIINAKEWHSEEALYRSVVGSVLRIVLYIKDGEIAGISTHGYCGSREKEKLKYSYRRY
jgi:hypothetical protein